MKRFQMLRMMMILVVVGCSSAASDSSFEQYIRNHYARFYQNSADSFQIENCKTETMPIQTAIQFDNFHKVQNGYGDRESVRVGTCDLTFTFSGFHPYDVDGSEEVQVSYFYSPKEKTWIFKDRSYIQ